MQNVGQNSLPRSVIAIQSLLLVSAVLIAAVLVRPAGFIFPGTALDPSWMAAAGYAADHRMLFGTDIVFTTGPLSALYHRLYPHRLAGLIVCVGVVLLVTLCSLLYRLSIDVARTSRTSWFACIYAVMLIVLSRNLNIDGIIFFYIFGTSYLCFYKRMHPVVLVASIAVMAAYGLAKFSFAAFALPALILVDLLSLFRKQMPYKTILFVGISWNLFAFSGQPWAEFPNYISASLDVMGGFSAAMSIQGSAKELLLWCAMSATVIWVLMRAVWHIRGNTPDRDLISLFHLVLFCGFFALLLKAGFVRHDGHAMIAWTGMFLAIPTIIVWHDLKRFEIGALIVPLFVSALYLSLLQGLPLAGANAVGLVQYAAANVWETAAFFRDPKGWMVARDALYDETNRNLRIAANLPDFHGGSVDIISSRQSELIASNANYRPRPTIQEYSTYTKKMIERNRAFFLSAAAPDFILFAPGSIDGRHPASAEGPLWPLFLQRYDAGESTGDLLVLRKRTQPLSSVLKDPVLKRSSLGARVAVPDAAGPQFVKIDVRYNLLGRIAGVIVNPPGLALRAIYASGATEDYRLIPEIAREGSILVPTIKTSAAFEALYRGGTDDSTQDRPVAFEIVADRFRAWGFEDSVSYSFAEVNMLPQ